jgi:hypothetical protein
MSMIMEEIKHLITSMNYYQLLLIRDFLSQRIESMENRGPADEAQEHNS